MVEKRPIAAVASISAGMQAKAAPTIQKLVNKSI
jgi:hypothetical protein